MQIHFIRHGESIDDEEERYGGLCNLGLTETGRIQVNRIVEGVKATKINFILSSPLRRALESAAIIKNEVKLDNSQIYIVHELHERNSYGILTGHKRSETSRLFEGFLVLDPSTKSGFQEPIPGAEEIDDFRQRVHRSWDEVQKFFDDDTGRVIGIVAHRNYFNMLADVLGLSDFSSLSHGELRSFDV